MGRFRPSDFREVPLPPEKFYYIHLNKTFETEVEAERELNNINMMLRRLRGKQYPEISFFIGISATDGDAAYKTVRKTGKIGRPQVLVKGKRVKPHLHIVVYGKLCASFCRAFSRKYNILNGKSIARSHKCQSTRYISYSYQQSYRHRTCGDFDFSQYYDGMYLDVYPALGNYVNSDQEANDQISLPLQEKQRTADYIIHIDNRNRGRAITKELTDIHIILNPPIQLDRNILLNKILYSELRICAQAYLISKADTQLNLYNNPHVGLIPHASLIPQPFRLRVPRFYQPP